MHLEFFDFFVNFSLHFVEKTDILKDRERARENKGFCVPISKKCFLEEFI